MVHSRGARHKGRRRPEHHAEHLRILLVVVWKHNSVPVVFTSPSFGKGEVSFSSQEKRTVILHMAESKEVLNKVEYERYLHKWCCHFIFHGLQAPLLKNSHVPVIP